MERIIRRLDSVENRLSQLESTILNVENENSYRNDQQAPTEDNTLISVKFNEEDSGLESQIGRFGLAWLGNIVLLFGIIFLTQYLMILGYRSFSIILGYFAAGAIFLVAGYLEKANTHLAFIFKMNSQVLLFYLTLRLHFFTTSPIISDRTISVILLIIIILLQAYLSVRSKSQAFAALSVIFALTTALVAETTHFMLPLSTLAAAGACYYYYRFNWGPLLIVTIIFTYVTFFLWVMGNPIMGHTFQLIENQNSGVIYLFALGSCFSVLLLFRKHDGSSDDFLTGMTFLNGILFTFLMIFVVLGFYSKNFVALFSIVTIFCLFYSIILYSRSDWHFASAFYALYGFMAMSIALYGLYGFPQVYLLLSVQSLIVVSMALWFRNRLIIVMNSILFLTILIIYLLTSKPVAGINFSFALISLISARIINWKRARLQIKTDLIRNLYMVVGFFMVLYSLFHALPRQFITLSWTIAALLYFLIGYILKNVKYRYMALGTMICAALYLFIADLAKIDLIYRVLALLFLAVISIGISIYYTNRIKK